jgi:hypothetical protein
MGFAVCSFTGAVAAMAAQMPQHEFFMQASSPPTRKSKDEEWQASIRRRPAVERPTIQDIAALHLTAGVGLQYEPSVTRTTTTGPVSLQ